MTLEVIVTWVLAGILAGMLAGFFMDGRGRGLTGDVPLGLVGSMVGGWIFWTLGSGDAGLVASAIVSLAAAAILIFVQRRFWPATARRL
jgi:uncharacterized membrane protein YeaQ/YmgE (transglycosylase-associated protein family)